MLEHRRAFATPSPRGGQRNPPGSRNKGLGRRRPPLVMRQHHVATPSSSKPLLRLLGTQPLLG
jgi:hypothetical protein